MKSPQQTPHGMPFLASRFRGGVVRHRPIPVLLTGVIAGLNCCAWRMPRTSTPLFGWMGIASLILLLVLPWRAEPLPRAAGIWRAFLFMGLLNNVLPFCLIVWG